MGLFFSLKLRDLRENWRFDLQAGFIVSLVALPLCLGIAMASGVPPMAGIIAGIVGGMLVSITSGSYVTINGPAAGLAVIVLLSIDGFRGLAPRDFSPEQAEMFAYQSTLAVGLVCGLLQVLFGFLRSGVLSNFFPSSVVHGMMSAIGIMIFAKQFHVAMGVKSNGKEMLDVISSIPASIQNMNPEVAIIAGVSLLVLVLLPISPIKWIRKIPAPLMVILTAIPMGYYFDLQHEHKYLFLGNHEYTLGPKFLVSLPSNPVEGIVYPDFSQLFTPFGIQMIITFALVASLESLLTAVAIDRLDPLHRKSDFNRELFGKGSGNIVSSFLGGLPIIAEVVRSSANINFGARTPWSNFFHGLFLLAFLVLFSDVIHSIPLAALAAMLMYTGFKLASPKSFMQVYHVGKEQLLIFVATIVFSIANDLLIGIFAGILVKLLVHLYNGVPARNLFKPFFTVETLAPGQFLVDVQHSAVFSNYLKIRNQLDKIEKGKTLIIDFSKTKLVDNHVMEQLELFGKDYVRSGGNFAIRGLENHLPMGSHPQSGRKVVL